MGKGKRTHSSDVDSDQESDGPKSKKTKSSKAAAKNAPSSARKDSDDQLYWDLATSKRKATIQEFKGTTFIHIREYYEKDGVHLPGKKGITLNVEQYNALVGAIPSINAALIKKGEDVECLAIQGKNYGAEVVREAPKKRKVKPKRANIDATSDEDDG